MNINIDKDGFEEKDCKEIDESDKKTIKELITYAFKIININMERAKYIKERLDEIFEGKWCCLFCTSNAEYGVYYSYYTNYIKYNFINDNKEYIIIIFKQSI